MKNLLSIILFLAVAPVTVADNHGTIENRPVETWMCSFNEGQTMADLDEWYVAFNEHAETMQNNSFNSFVWVPTFVSDLKAADVALTFSFPTLTEMGTTMDEFFGSEGGADDGSDGARRQRPDGTEHGRESHGHLPTNDE